MTSQETDDSGPPQPGGTQEPEEASRAAEGHASALPGARLLAERRAQGLSLGDVARQLKLSVRQVEALERDEYAAFPGAVFVRGFLRNYAKLLQLDPEELVAQAAIETPRPAVASVSPPTVPVPLREPGPRRRTRLGFGALTAALVLLIVVAAVVYDARNKPAPVSLSSVAPASTAAQEPGVQQAESASPASPGTGTTAAGSNSTQANGGTEAANATQAAAAAAVSETIAAPAPAAPAAAASTQSNEGAAEVKLSFDDESWVEIKDASGTVIFSRLNPAGSEQVVRGDPPLDLVIGNAQSVRLTYGDKPVDLAPHTRVDVARIRLK